MEFKKCTFANSIEPCDGKNYIDCDFDNCQLLYSGGDLPSFVRCNLKETGFIFTGAAGNTLQLLQSMYAGGFAPIVEQLINIIQSPPANNSSGDTNG
jgi:hypothetical protein